MKNYLYVLTVFSVLSCTTENSDFDLSSKLFKGLTKSNADGIESPSSAGNPYDYIGASYNKVYEAYEALGTTSKDPATIVPTVEYLSNEQGMIAGKGYIPITAATIIALKQGTITTSETIFSISGLTNAVKNELSQLINELQSLKNANEPYDIAFLKITEKENVWQLSAVLTQNEKKILLYTSSVLRHSLYNTSKKKRKDRDWELSVGNIMATAYGAAQSVPNTIVIAVASEYID